MYVFRHLTGLSLYWPVKQNTANRIEVLQIPRVWTSIYRNGKHHLCFMLSPLPKRPVYEAAILHLLPPGRVEEEEKIIT